MHLMAQTREWETVNTPCRGRWLGSSLSLPNWHLSLDASSQPLKSLAARSQAFAQLEVFSKSSVIRLLQKYLQLPLAAALIPSPISWSCSQNILQYEGVKGFLFLVGILCFPLPYRGVHIKMHTHAYENQQNKIKQNETKRQEEKSLSVK